MDYRRLFCLVWIAAGSLPLALNAQSIVVGVTASPPFSYEAEGEWTGLSVDLWKAVAEDLELDYELRPMSVAEAVEGLSREEVDVVAAALVTTSERERHMDFANTYYSSGLSVATSTEQQSLVLAFLGALIQWETLAALGALTLVLLGVGFVIWAMERKTNPEQFGGSPVEGLGSGFWWSAVTMTTVGYGDKAPISLGGRMVGLVWMFASIILISGFTGAIASALTVSSLKPRIESFEDLYRADVGVIEGSAAQAFLRDRGIRAQPFADTQAGLAAVKSGVLEGFVNDAPVLRFYVQQDYPDALVVLENTFEPGFYAFGVRQGFGPLEQLNQSLLEVLSGAAWERIQRRHLGQ